ncbi:MAG TPA: VOC family protein [Dehalococcoidia bacterium]|jgi:catechol-2,3-dioxygenase|nr:VOC family protein [Dehalococcoidia bacterium]
MTATITRLNHAVLYVSDLDRSVDFYRRAFGFEEIAREGGMMAFLRASGGTNHHDLALASVGASAPRPPRGSTGLYHLAWQVAEIEDLAAMAQTLVELDALTGMSDHGATKSLYGADPDGIEFEVMWMVPREQWGEFDRRAVIRPLDLQREVQRFGKAASAG